MKGKWERGVKNALVHAGHERGENEMISGHVGGGSTCMGEGRRDVSKGKGHELFAGLLRVAWT